MGLTFEVPPSSRSWEQGELRASTRNGATLKFDKGELVKALEVKQILFSIPEDQACRSGIANEYILWDPTDPSWSEAFIQKVDAQKRRVELESMPIGAVDPQTGKYVGGRRYLKIGRITPDRVVLTNDIDSQFSWDALARSRIFGMITSRMYAGS